MKICKVKGCGGKHRALGYCIKHYTQISRYGKIQNINIWSKNDILIKKEYAVIMLRSVKCKITGKSKIDKEDIERCKKVKWAITRCRDGREYVQGKLNRKPISLHRFLLGERVGKTVIDHKNHDGLDNRKSNLRICTISENGMNRKSLGIGFNNDKKKWVARIQVDGKRHTLGNFENYDLAIKCRRQAEKIFFKEFAYNNKK
jgi:hypothetical protein